MTTLTLKYTNTHTHTPSSGIIDYLNLIKQFNSSECLCLSTSIRGIFVYVCMKENVFMVCFERSVRRVKRLCYDYLKYSSVIMNECRKERNALLFPLKYYLIKSLRYIKYNGG